MLLFRLILFLHPLKTFLIDIIEIWQIYQSFLRIQLKLSPLFYLFILSLFLLLFMLLQMLGV